MFYNSPLKVALIISLLRDPSWSSSDFASIYSLLRGCSDLELCLTNNPAFKFFVSKCPYFDRGMVAKPSVSFEYPNFLCPYQPTGGGSWSLGQYPIVFGSNFMDQNFFLTKIFFLAKIFCLDQNLLLTQNFLTFGWV